MEAQSKSKDQEKLDDAEETEAVELVLFQVSECYVYLIPPRKTTASYRADEWNVNKWAWEGTLKVISKGEECIIRLEDKATGELYARAFLRSGEPHPVEPVVDSSRYLNKKKTAEEMEQQYQHTSSVDYSLKEGETIVLQLKNKSGRSPKSKLFEQSMSNLSLEEKGNGKEPVVSLKPPPPPAATVTPAATIQKAVLSFPLSSSPVENPKTEAQESSKEESKESHTQENQCAEEDVPDDDFGDFQTAG
ncbi:hypothetical protein CDL15_Pgr001467 [Punica granatum]|uniref:NECAP PHear domain-containing protein n=1 Tax=Punica granatum TaxID=22663 RepID=A0A218WL90_PUNGR|nr:hypothetical protein CDL15_Pgr001467 [Punica granatum]